MTDLYEIDTDLTREEALDALARASEMWGATWTREGDGGRLDLPVIAGLKLGLMSGPVRVDAGREGSRISFQVEESRYRLQRPAIAILVLGGLGGIAATLWPFFPALLAVAPLAVVVAIGAWILVASRLRTSTPNDFLELVTLDGSAETVL